MAKGKNNSSPANDYIEQLQWRSRHNHRFWSVRYEPKWKYKIVYRNPPVTPFDIIGQAILFIVVIAAAIALFSSDTATIGEKVFFGTIFGLILAIVFFAVRDIPKDKDDKPKDLDE